MELAKISRPLDQKELRLLRLLKINVEQELKRQIPYHYFIVAILAGAGFAWLATVVTTTALEYICGALGILAIVGIVFGPVDIFRSRRLLRQRLASIDAISRCNELTVIPVSALRIAVAEEYEDEGALFLIEYRPGFILYFWDRHYQLRKFPCLHFEIYEEGFHELTRRQINPLSDRIKPIVIDKASKWAYLQKVGAPAQLSIEQKDFYQLVAEWNSMS